MLRRSTYHIFHFIGHGTLSPDTQEGVLIFEDDKARGRAVAASTLGTLLRDHSSLRVAVLNACEGGRTAEDDAFSGTAQALLQQGIPAVVAMQSPISDRAAICFSREFYSAIRDGCPLDFALAEARKAIFADVNELEWATPVLYLRSPDARMFSSAFAPAPASTSTPAALADAPLSVPAPAPVAVEAAPVWLPHLREAIGLTHTAGLLNIFWRTLTFTTLLLGSALLGVGSLSALVQSAHSGNSVVGRAVGGIDHRRGDGLDGGVRIPGHR